MKLDGTILEQAYRVGIFPMADDDGTLHWFRPDPRAILPLDGFRCSRSLRRTWRKGHFSLTLDRDFVGVMRACADRAEGTWISDAIVAAYSQLHRAGRAHSLEVWCDGKLAGGVYGVHLGRAFFAESKFHRVTDASKIALWALVESLRRSGFRLLEVQYLTEHLDRLGAVEISLTDYLARLAGTVDDFATLVLAQNPDEPDAER